VSAEKIANRYASALLTLTQGQETLCDSIADNLEEIARLFDDKEVKKLLSSPVVPASVLEAVFEHAVQQLHAEVVLSKFLKVIVDNRRAGILPAVAKAFRRRLQAARGVVSASITSAVTLEAEDLTAIRGQLESMLGKKVVLSSLIDKSILGGFVIRIENSVLDMSLRHKLEKMTHIAVS
jgi:F-type H+-transporting ATPase subunit delta